MQTQVALSGGGFGFAGPPLLLVAKDIDGIALVLKGRKLVREEAWGQIEELDKPLLGQTILGRVSNRGQKIRQWKRMSSSHRKIALGVDDGLKNHQFYVVPSTQSADIGELPMILPVNEYKKILVDMSVQVPAEGFNVGNSLQHLFEGTLSANEPIMSLSVGTVQRPANTVDPCLERFSGKILIGETPPVGGQTDPRIAHLSGTAHQLQKVLSDSWLTPGETHLVIAVVPSPLELPGQNFLRWVGKLITAGAPAQLIAEGAAVAATNSGFNGEGLAHGLLVPRC